MCANSIFFFQDFNDFYTSDDPEALNQQLKQLQKQVSHMETQVNQLETKLTTRRERRAKEASLTNLSPEERADVVAQQERDIEEGETPDLDVIFEYLLLLGSSTEDDIGDLSTNDFLQPHEGIRKKALESSMVNLIYNTSLTFS
jgi:TolA-binding protein